MPKITVHGGPSIWRGNHSSISSKTPEKKTNEAEPNLPKPAQTMESHSEKDQEESFSVSPTDGSTQEMQSSAIDDPELQRLLGM